MTSRVQVTNHGSCDVWRISLHGVWRREAILGDAMSILGSMAGGHAVHGSMVAIRCSDETLREQLLGLMLATVYTGAAVWVHAISQYLVIRGQGEQWAEGDTFRITHHPEWDDPHYAVRVAERIIMRAGRGGAK